MERKRTASEFFLAASVLIWGFSFISIKVCAEAIPIAFLSFIRFLLAAVVLIIMCAVTDTREKLQKRHILRMAVSGVMGITLYYFFEGIGIKGISASSVSIINATIPLFTLMAEAIVYGLRIRLAHIAALIISILGIGFIVGLNLKQLMQSGHLKGYLFILLSVLCWVAYTLITKSLFKNYSEITITTYQTIIGAIAFIPFIFTEHIPAGSFNGSIICNVIFLGIFSSALAYYFFAVAIKNIGSVKSSMGLNIVPIITIIGSQIILRENITLNILVGSLLILMSMKITQRVF
ncbi:MAG: DMT family transporter [Bacillota bacterium]|nr:DMT family transporter [Bacillota bacterium]